MFAARKRRRAQNGMLLAGLGLCLYFLAVYQPLSRQVAALDQPLLKTWQDLAQASAQVTSPDHTQLPKIDAALQSVQDARALLERSRQALVARIRPAPQLTERINSSFQLIEFQNERQLATEQIWRLARQKKVQLDPNLAGGFPEYFADRRQPALLWAQLRLLQDVLNTAVSSEVSRIESISSPAVEVHSAESGRPDYLANVPVEIELVGTANAVQRFLESIPLRAEEILDRGLPEAAPGKPAYFIDRLFLRKEARDKVDEVRLRAVIRGFVELNGGGP
ncbi:MAG: hypothetical protein KJ072_14655 [Verrucomicrobia bacterium]|nr:hypothetical protein [Verrucomicrobiota bacterium]